VKSSSFDVVESPPRRPTTNVVVSLLSNKPNRGAARGGPLNDPRNEWPVATRTGVWTCAVTAAHLASLVRGGVAVGDLVRLMEFPQGPAQPVEITLPDDTLGAKPSKRPATCRATPPGYDSARPEVIWPEADEPLGVATSCGSWPPRRSRTIAGSGCIPACALTSALA